MHVTLRRFARAFVDSKIFRSDGDLNIDEPICGSAYAAFGRFVALSLLHEVPLSMEVSANFLSNILNGGLDAEENTGPGELHVYNEKVNFIRQGFTDIIPQHLLEGLTADRLMLFLKGAGVANPRELVVNANLVGYTQSSRQIIWLQTAVRSMTQEELRKFLALTTGSHRVPHGGLVKHFHPFAIHAVTESMDFFAIDEMKLLGLPLYETEGELRSHLNKYIKETYDYLIVHRNWI